MMTTMTTHYPIVFETEDSGAVSAYVAGLPVYAQAATLARAERAIQAMLVAYFEAHPEQTAPATIRVAKVDALPTRRLVKIVSAAALVGARTSHKKATSARANGLLGGRPRMAKR